MNYKLLMACAVLFLLVASCTKAPCGCDVETLPADKGRCGEQDDRDCTTAVCTYEFRQIPLEVVDASGNIVVLDSYYTEDMSGKRFPATYNSYNSATGVYVVFSDAWLPDNRNKTIRVRFIGIKNGATVVNELFTLSSDCCHVYKVSGKDKVIVS